MECPEYHHVLATEGTAWICPDHGVVRPRLFLSYGRRDAADLARQLCGDLERHGYRVWLDASQISVGSRWEEVCRWAETGTGGHRRPQSCSRAARPLMTATASVGTKSASPHSNWDSPSFRSWRSSVKCHFRWRSLHYLNFCEWRNIRRAIQIATSTTTGCRRPGTERRSYVQQLRGVYDNSVHECIGGGFFPDFLAGVVFISRCLIRTRITPPRLQTAGRRRSVAIRSRKCGWRRFRRHRPSMVGRVAETRADPG